MFSRVLILQINLKSSDDSGYVKELVKTLRRRGYSEKAVEEILRWYRD